MIDAYAEPGAPERRGPGRYLWWLLARQPGRAWAGAGLGTVWMILVTLSPYVLSRAVEDGLVPGDTGALVAWSAALLGLQAFNAWVSIMRHRVMTRLRMDANFRTVKSLIAQAVRLGAALPRQTGAGEVVTIGVTDVQQISQSLTMTGPGVGVAVAYAVVCWQLLAISVSLGVVVVLGVPVIALLVGPLLGRLRGAESEYREQQGVLTSRIGDLAGGLRVLNGLGGKELYARAFRRDSRRLVAQGYRVGGVTSWVQALGTGLPMLFLAVVTWLAARMAARGDISVGQLVAVYGYVAVLVGPVAFFIESGYDVTRGLVAAGRVVRFLSLEPDSAARPATADAPAGPAPLRDPASGVEAAPGRLTAVVSARPADAAALADRLAGFLASDVTWGPVRLDEVARAQVRERILLADNEADLFAGTLREVVAGRWAPHPADRPRVPVPDTDRARTTGTDEARAAGTGTARTTETGTARTAETDEARTAGTGTTRTTADEARTAEVDEPRTTETGAARTTETGTARTAETGTTRTTADGARTAEADDARVPAQAGPHGGGRRGDGERGEAQDAAPAGAARPAPGRPRTAPAEAARFDAAGPGTPPSGAAPTPGGADAVSTAVAEALRAAVAEDVVGAMPDGLGSAVEAQGRNLSGGQRQRVRLARALFADPEVLIAVEPTSALDAHTEAAVARRLRAARAGRTTVVTGTSPLLLDQADTVYYLVDGRVAAVGGHRELLASEPGYRGLVSRGPEDGAGDDPRDRGNRDSGDNGRSSNRDRDHGDGDGGPRRSEEALR